MRWLRYFNEALAWALVSAGFMGMMIVVMWAAWVVLRWVFVG